MLTAYLDSHGIHRRPLLTTLALLAAGWCELDELVLTSALPRRTVEELLTACAPDLESDGGRHRIRPSVAEHYLAARRPSGAEPGLLEAIAADIAGAPAPLAKLDHVPATAATAARRAQWLDSRYWLAGARLLLLGDHDLTSLAVCAIRPDLDVTVVDLDERLLGYIDAVATARGWRIRCLHADLRFGLPPAAADSADLVFTDPPYTPDGMALFVSRAVACLRTAVQGRVIAAYGYSARQPALGLAVQQAMQRCGVVFEAILPEFHRYHGAQAIGSAADMYVLQPTAHALKINSGTRIYTRGSSSVESQETQGAALDAVREFAKTETVRRPGWSAAIHGDSLAFDLAADPGPWLARMLLASDAERVALLVGNNHPDLIDARSQQALSQLLGARYRLRFHRSTPDRKHAVVLATTPRDAPSSAAGELLRRAHGKLGNMWREALITTSGGELTKRQAREMVHLQASAAGLAEALDLRLIDLPRHQIQALLTAVC